MGWKVSGYPFIYAGAASKAEGGVAPRGRHGADELYLQLVPTVTVVAFTLLGAPPSLACGAPSCSRRAGVTGIEGIASESRAIAIHQPADEKDPYAQASLNNLLGLTTGAWKRNLVPLRVFQRPGRSHDSELLTVGQITDSDLPLDLICAELRNEVRVFLIVVRKTRGSAQVLRGGTPLFDGTSLHCRSSTSSRPCPRLPPTGTHSWTRPSESLAACSWVTSVSVRNLYFTLLFSGHLVHWPAGSFIIICPFVLSCS